MTVFDPVALHITNFDNNYIKEIQAPDFPLEPGSLTNEYTLSFLKQFL